MLVGLGTTPPVWPRFQKESKWVGRRMSEPSHGPHHGMRLCCLASRNPTSPLRLHRHRGNRYWPQGKHPMRQDHGSYDCLTDRKLVKEFQAEFEARMAKDPFVSLCDSNKSPAGALDAKERHVYECCIHSAMESFGIAEGPHAH
ncbi:expressed unknown protein [Seminavis robusta]|uniref:Uncharacterized protein n=1 Tax=Seminavis robusta TaxID=568900 RepID=A0A9N8HMK6_9STRA|nr:expressed unknown protein [Seminavis robusta]|eukprot:Sro1008_g230630.1 n/a (144) ;mRNA; f:37517-38071